MLTFASVDEANAATAKDKIRRIPFGAGPAIPQRPVAILGAGVGGLYAAMILKCLGIPFDILEATGRTGGRLFTYKVYNGNFHDYYDVGAMRTPQQATRCGQDSPEPFHEAALYAFQLSAAQLTNGPKLAHKLLDYKFNCDGATTAFVPRSPTPRTLSGSKRRVLIQSFYLSAARRFLRRWDKLLKFDNYYSTRGNMTLVKGIDAVTVDWVETATYGTGWFDKALSELVLEYIAFSSYLKNSSINALTSLDRKLTVSYSFSLLPFLLSSCGGGSRVLPDFTTKYVNEKRPNALQLGKRVTEIYYAAPDEATSTLTPVCIKVEGEDKTREYGHVISTLPLPVLRSLSIDDPGLDVKQANALRQLQYGPSEKIESGSLHLIFWFGLNSVIRTVVYPSFGIPGNPPESTVLIPSYSWTEDALRLGAMISAGGALKNQVEELGSC
ncbi:hypothetical protein M407DRAFT_16957 [Tulasnella calospora MUT 4182]|uniref:Amine oxidase domain-containing protein n=1 Tax=Tulasnella calospora MUT 4182 TaxID=1051891 RepID=A0A0C3QWV8_9AGAM|nr:hypothetical protein M407DRAFT_16957 [Tulasnella calospora MUT 4182]